MNKGLKGTVFLIQSITMKRGYKFGLHCELVLSTLMPGTTWYYGQQPNKTHKCLLGQHWVFTNSICLSGPPSDSLLAL